MQIREDGDSHNSNDAHSAARHSGTHTERVFARLQQVHSSDKERRGRKT